ncbi:MAG: hypothetical protein C0480_02135 [Bradyrhizobium sp.]|nr:hypothetical protein [Bradyrhizobium sp.]
MLLADSSCNDGLSRSWSSNIKRSGCVLWLLVAGAGFMPGAVMAEPRTAPNEPVAFDLPAQALPSAIEAYSVASGWQVIYDASLAAGRQSAPVRGRYAPAAALRTLLAGTGLMAEFMAADGAMLLPDPAATNPALLEPAPHVRDYYGRLQASLKRAFCADQQIRARGYRIALGFWIGASGTVTRVASLGSTGEAGIDAAFDRAVRRVSVGQSPPPGFEQPVVILVTPDLLAQCNAASLQTVRTAQ